MLDASILCPNASISKSSILHIIKLNLKKRYAMVKMLGTFGNPDDEDNEVARKTSSAKLYHKAN